MAVGSLNSPAIGADGVIYFGVRGKYEQGNNPSVNGHVFAVEYNASAAQFHKVWNYEVAGQIDWNHPAIGPNGGIYIGSSVGGEADPFKVYEPGEIPPNTTCKFYALKPLVSSVNDQASQITGFQLEQNYPNPLRASAINPETVIEYQLPRPSEVEISIFNLQGQKVATLARKHQTAGAHKIIWNGTDESGRRVASGVYLYQLKAGKSVQVKKMLVLR
jgi:hypothetical protein